MRRKQLRMMGSNGAAVFGTRIPTAAVGQGDYFGVGAGCFRAGRRRSLSYSALAVMPVQMLEGNFSSGAIPPAGAIAQRAGTAKSCFERFAHAGIQRQALWLYAGRRGARLILSLVFGAKWEDAIPLVQILGDWLTFDAVSWAAGALLQARGEFRRSLVYSCVFSPIFFVLVAIGAVNFLRDWCGDQWSARST